jgi:atypical dual specificity phosphatase
LIAKADFDAPGDVLPRPHPNCYWLLPGRVLAGEHPSRQGAQAMAHLHRAGITHFIDLTSVHDRLPPYEPVNALHLPHPIVDFGVPTVAGMRRTLDAAAQALAAGGVIYLHCKAGIGRTGTVAGCLLVEHLYAPAESLALLQRKWQAAGQSAHASATPETEAQREFIAGWAARR